MNILQDILFHFHHLGPLTTLTKEKYGGPYIS